MSTEARIHGPEDERSRRDGDSVDTSGRDGHRNRWLLVVILAVGALAIAGTVLAITRDDGSSEATNASTPDATKPTPTTQPATTAIPPVNTANAIWPLESSAVRYRDPVSAARGFAVDYVGFVDPVVGAFRAGDSRSGEVPVQRSERGPETTVLVRQLGNDGTWWVLGSQTANIQATAPVALEPISSPVTLRGTSTAFEATLNVEVREDGNAEPLASTFLMGGANGQMGSFEGVVPFAVPHASSGAVVLFSRSPEDGRIAEATVVRVRFATS
jgi:hypothetical protein